MSSGRYGHDNDDDDFDFDDDDDDDVDDYGDGDDGGIWTWNSTSMGWVGIRNLGDLKVVDICRKRLNTQITEKYSTAMC